MTGSFNKMLVKAMHGKSIVEILNASPDALWDVSKSSAQKLVVIWSYPTLIM
jgi:hypothetical protein